MDHSSYYDLSRPQDGRERTSYFVLDSLLRSRIDCGFESDSGQHDEDVNVYLVHLLSSLIESPGFGKLAADHDIDVFDKVRDSSDPRFKCEVYRTNADHLLVSAGIFTDTPYVEKDGQRVYRESAWDRIGRGKTYYRFASAFHERIGFASPVVTRILARLSEDFERYVDVLFHMRGEYFNLYERIREDQIVSLQQDRFGTPAGPGESGELRILRDEFLDAYWLWHQTPDPTTRNSLIESIKRLRAADPSFDFQLPEQ